MATIVVAQEKMWQKKRRTLRNELWSDADKVVFKAGRDSGYCKVVPRIVPLVSVLAAHLKDRPGDLTATYVDLWLRTDNDGFVEVEDEYECAAAAGFLGGRALWSWRDRIRTLERLGLIRIKGEGLREIAYILVLNPEPVVGKLLKTHPRRKQTPVVWRDYYDKRRRDTGVPLKTP